MLVAVESDELPCQLFFFFGGAAPTSHYMLSLHDALPIFRAHLEPRGRPRRRAHRGVGLTEGLLLVSPTRSEEHTSELQSRQYLVCRLLLEKKQNYLD